jgi:dihydrolipoamide dehydrogenase
LSSTGALALRKVPEEIIVVGGGYIGLEIASIYARFGTKVTVVEEMQEIIPTMDRELARSFHSILKKQGLNIITSHKVVSGLNHGSYA